MSHVTIDQQHGEAVHTGAGAGHAKQTEAASLPVRDERCSHGGSTPVLL